MGLKFTRVLKSLNQTKQKKQEKKITIVTTYHTTWKVEEQGIWRTFLLPSLEQVLIGGGEKERWVGDCARKRARIKMKREDV